MKCFRKRTMRVASAAGAAAAVCLCLGAMKMPVLFHAGGGFARWIENVPAGSTVEGALFRAMQLPAGEFLFPRPPRETVPALTELQKSENAAALFPLRAMEEEQALDSAAAERDWKAWADAADDHVGAHLDLAEFYERRLHPQAELTALEWAGSAPPDPRERWTVVEEQRSWKAFDRALKVVEEYALGRGESERIYVEWIKRYPQEPAVYVRQIDFLLGEKDFAQADAAIAQYKAAFPQDRLFSVKAEADLAVRRGRPADGLAVYDSRFEPLWPAELIQDYFRLVLDSHQQRAFRDAARARLEANPDDLKDAARLFYLEQQQGQLDAAKAVLSGYRETNEERGAAWTPEELGTLEELFEAVQDFPEAARYAYAMAAQRTTPEEERNGTVALARILLTAPEQPLRVGAGNLSLYRDIATMDRGPGYLNGILSLFLNTQGPDNEYSREEQVAAPYFHRARAAELLEEIDKRFPDDPSRPLLHAKLMEAYATYGDSEAVIREGIKILADYPHFAGRVRVALELADAYERTKQSDKEFALYQDLLKELAAEADGVPLGGGGKDYSKPVAQGNSPAAFTLPAVRTPQSEGEARQGDSDDAGAEDGDTARAAAAPVKQGARSTDYAQVLDRYLGRLVALRRLPDALAVLRGELDRNPQDPGLYERLADFLDQNHLNAHIEEAYQRAIAQFQDTGWYAKLARFYLRERRAADYRGLMQNVADIFSGTEMEAFLEEAPAPDSSLAVEVNRYAAGRFPHELGFVPRLIAQDEKAHNDAAVEKLLWAHWAESADLRDQLFQVLSRTGRLDGELVQLRQQSPEIDKADWNGLAERNPAAERFWVEACLWQSRYEQAVAAADALAAAYPADAAVGAQASSLFRSLAYFHPEDTDRAFAVESRLLEARPGNLDILARIGDIYADRGRFAAASPYWLKMANVRPGQADGYLQSATVFWDYFDFADAHAQLERGQARLHNATVFGYQQGAIEESRGDVPAAIRVYVASATAEHPSSESKDRLLTLARRPAWQPQVESGTVGLLRVDAPGAAAIELRAGILEAEHRKDGLAQELQQLVARTASFDVLDAVTNAAHSNALPDVEEASLRRQIALTTDPVHGIQLRYQLVDLLDRRNPAEAGLEVDAIYHEHGRILGVVRSTVDYNWNHDRRQQSVTALLDSAAVAYPELRSRFHLEAARKLTDLGEYARSRTLLESLLKGKPLDAGYESAMADNLAHAGEQPALDGFYRAQLDVVQKASLPREEMQHRLAQLRRGIVAADTVLGKFNEAVDQYIELIRAYPDDGALAQEAALYAVSRGARERLFGYFQKAVLDSPRDARWSIVLARLATAAEDEGMALEAYDKALHLRPERQDLYISAAQLDERLGRFEDAIGLDRKLYTLSYRDPKWMVKVAELCARQRKEADAVNALETALIEGRPAKPAYFFDAAGHLETWGMLEAAQKYADRGVELAGADLLVTEQNGAATYTKIMARRRKSTEAFARLKKARADAPELTLQGMAQQVAREGADAVTDTEWRKQRQDQRAAAATRGFAQALQVMAGVAAADYTPEEKTQFGTLLRENARTADKDELANVFLPAAKSAELAQLWSDLEWALILKREAEGEFQIHDWLQFEKRRVQPAAAAAELEKLAPSLKRENAGQAWRAAAGAYRDAGDAAGELRAMGRLSALGQLQDQELNRYYSLLLGQRPEELIDKSHGSDSAAQYLVRNGTAAQALAAVDARSGGRSSVWKDAYTGLAGLYLRDHSAGVRAAFDAALGGDANIGERIGHPADRQRQLAGSVWFYYGSRYATWLDEENDPRREDYEDAELEAAPGNAGAYLRLADYSAGQGRAASALTDYAHSLDLNADQPAVVNKIADIQWKNGNRADAQAAWDKAVKLLAAEMDARHVPETFWGDFATVLKTVSAARQFDSVRAQVDAMLRVYLKRNGTYRSEPLLEAAYLANAKSIEWLLDITASASDQQAVLWSILPHSWSEQGKWIEKGQLSRIDQKILEISRAREQDRSQTWEIDAALRNLLEAFLDERKFSEAGQILNSLPQARRDAPDLLPLILRLADANGSLTQLIGTWNKKEGGGPVLNDLRNAVASLSRDGQRAVLRYVYETAISRRDLTAANFVGLAAIHLDENDTAGAAALLKRLTLVSANMYTDEDAAAGLLEQRHKQAEAVGFLRALASANPWDANYRMRLARAMLEADPRATEPVSELNAVATDSSARYADRMEAARALKGRGAPTLDSGELKMLAAPGCPSAQSASQPMYVAAQVEAAECTDSAQAKAHLLGDALAAAPGNAALRARYIFAAFDANENARALTAASPYLQGSYYPAVSEGDPGATGSSTSGADSTDAQQVNPVTLAGMNPADAARLIELSAAAYERLSDFTRALNVLTEGLDVVHDEKLRKQLEQHRDAAQAEVARAAENDARAPHIVTAVEQDRVVQPKLMPGMPVPERPAKEEQP